MSGVRVVRFHDAVLGRRFQREGVFRDAILGSWFHGVGVYAFWVYFVS